MRALDILFTFAFLAAMLGYGLWQVYRHKRLTANYFSGGSLAGQTIRLLNPPSIVTRGNEIYQRDTAGIYIYKGVVDDSNVVKYKEI